jgi:hypothetical protein
MWLRRVYFVLSKFLRAKMLAPKRQAVFLKESRDVDCSSGNLEAATDNLYNVGHFRSWHFSGVAGLTDDVGSWG